MTESVKRTALFDTHKSLGAKTIDFGGWDMPVQYESVLAEHKAVREACGLFDVSHMGEVRVSGPEAEKYLQFLTINDITKLTPGSGQYSSILRENGCMIDDLIIYRLKADEFFICVNASNATKDFQWFKEQSTKFNVKVTDESPLWSQIAVQGPTSVETLAAILSPADQAKAQAADYMTIFEVTLFGEKALAARTGYTGEKGFELYLPHTVAVKSWNGMLATKEKTGVRPIGLGARDTLRLEACYLLYGNDMDETVNPLEAGIAWAVKLDKGDFIGSQALKTAKAQGLKRKTVAFVLEDQGIPRHGMDIYSGEKKIGTVSSGSFLPTLNVSGGMALISSDYGQVGDTFEVDVRGKRKLAKVMKRPLYTAKVK